MGDMWSHTYFEGTKPDVIPDSDEKPTFDPNFGFPAPRKERVSQISLQEMKALRMKKSERDYCAHFLKDYLFCRRYYNPIHGFCNPELHAYHHCQAEDYILRLKEYEREKRLRIREQKLKERAK